MRKGLEILNGMKDVKKAMDESDKLKLEESEKIKSQLIPKMMGVNQDQITSMDIEEFMKEALAPFDGMDLDNLSSTDVVKEEFKRWGLSRQFHGYKILMYIMSNYKLGDNNEKPDIDKVYDDLSTKFNKSKLEIDSYINNVIKKANFSNTIFFPLFKSLKSHEITPEMVINEFMDYLPSSEKNSED